MALQKQYFKWGVKNSNIWPRGHAHVKEFIEIYKYKDSNITCSNPEFGDEITNTYISYLEADDTVVTDYQPQMDKIIMEIDGIKLDDYEAVKMCRDFSPDGVQIMDSTATTGYVYVDAGGRIVQDTTNATDPYISYEGYPVMSAADVDRLTATKIRTTILSLTNGIDPLQDQLKIVRELLVAICLKSGYVTDVQAEMTVGEANALILNQVTTNSLINTIRSDGQTAKTAGGF